jgi:hypothetical protein
MASEVNECGDWEEKKKKKKKTAESRFKPRNRAFESDVPLFPRRVNSPALLVANRN